MAELSDISYDVAVGWIGQLAKAYVGLKKKKQDELNMIGNIFGPPKEIANYYIQPECQQINPANDDEDQASSRVRSPVLKTIAHFLSGEIASKLGDRHMFVLSDAGMGKSSLLIMLKMTHMSSFWPNSFDCVLFKLGADTIEDIRAIEGKQNTVLLLDSLDEDPAAWSDTRARLVSLLDETSHFRRVIITCRTQFFPTTQQDVFERPGYVEVGGYSCPSIYLSLFSRDQIREYLTKRFPRSFWQALIQKDDPKYAKAENAVEKMQSLRCRPMLLAHIDGILDGERNCETEFEMYDVLVSQWLKREEIKARKRGDSLTAAELEQAATVVAIELQRSGLRILPVGELTRLCAKSPVLNKLGLVEISGRSLLNKTSDGEYRFSHYTIQEFLVAKALLDKQISLDTHRLHTTPFLAQMWAQRVSAHVDYELVWITSGEFQMGSIGKLGESPRHSVKIQGFCLGRYPVTNEQYARYLVANPNVPKPDYWSDRKFNQPKQPVVGVSWDDAQKYCTWAGLRLPSEAEWEYACRAGSKTSYWSGDSQQDLAKAAWYEENSGARLHQVGEKEANGFGLYDMHGNVLEWVEDCRHENYQGAPEDGSAWVVDGDALLRVFRGGSWRDSAGLCRAAVRNGWLPDIRDNDLGFRPARSFP